MSQKPFQPSYVMALIQEAKNCLDEADDPSDAVRENPHLMSIIQEMVLLSQLPEDTGMAGDNDVSHGGFEPPIPEQQQEVLPLDPTPSSWTAKVIMPSSAGEELTVAAECWVCGMDGVKGTFFRRGFTCQRCVGQHRLLKRGGAGGLSGSRRTVLTDHHYYASRCPSKTCRGFVDCTALLGNPSTMQRLEPTDAYVVSYVPHRSEQATTAHGLEVLSTFRQRTLAQLRLLAHPSLLYLFSCGEDCTRHRTFFVHEAATPLSQMLMQAAHGATSDMIANTDVGSYSFFENVGVASSNNNVGETSSAASTSGTASPARVASSSTLDEVCVSSPVGKDGPLMVPGQHLEWVRKVAFAGLDALEHLHKYHLFHGHCTPSHIFVDDHGTIKLKATIVGALDWQHHVLVDNESRFLPPEATDGGKIVPPSVAADLFMLGSTLVELLLKDAIVEGGESRSLHPMELLAVARVSYGPGNANINLDTFLSFLESLTQPIPASRPTTAAKALQHPVFTSLRVVNGIPAETMGATIAVRFDTRDGNGSGVDSCFGSSSDLRRQRAVSWKADSSNTQDVMLSQTASTVDSSSGMLWVHRGEQASPLSQFLSDHGPKFQVVRAARSSLTLYSLKSDPRRRRAASVVDHSSSPFNSSATSVNSQ